MRESKSRDKNRDKSRDKNRDKSRDKNRDKNRDKSRNRNIDRSRNMGGLTLVLLCTLIILSFAGCAGREKSGNVSETCLWDMEEQGSEEPKDTEPQTASILSESAEELAEAVTVCLETQLYRGSGVVWSVGEDQIVILTAGHVLLDIQTLKVTFSDGSVVSWPAGERGLSWTVFVSDEADFGIITLAVTGMEELQDTMRCVAVDKDAFDELTAEDMIMAAGFGGEDEFVCLWGRVVTPWIYVEDFAQYMMIVKVDASQGMSGGGVYDSEGNLCGLLCGITEEGEAAVLPLGILLSLLEEWDN